MIKEEFFVYLLRRGIEFSFDHKITLKRSQSDNDKITEFLFDHKIALKRSQYDNNKTTASSTFK